MVTELRTKGKFERHHNVDIRGHHALCEMNFYRMETLMPAYQDGVDLWTYEINRFNTIKYLVKAVSFKVVCRAPYTTTVEIQQKIAQSDTAAGTYLPTSKLVVRMYNDVKMAEIVSWDDHKNWFPEYQYPNAQMYSPDEKLELNRFLGDCLGFYRREARITCKNCDPVLAYLK